MPVQNCSWWKPWAIGVGVVDLRFLIEISPNALLYVYIYIFPNKLCTHQNSIIYDYTMMAIWQYDCFFNSAMQVSQYVSMIAIIDFLLDITSKSSIQIVPFWWVYTIILIKCIPWTWIPGHKKKSPHSKTHPACRRTELGCPWRCSKLVPSTWRKPLGLVAIAISVDCERNGWG